jgi:hypothetical protein
MLRFFRWVKFTHSALVAHMSKLTGALHVLIMEFFIIFETSHRQDASMIN